MSNMNVRTRDICEHHLYRCNQLMSNDARISYFLSLTLSLSNKANIINIKQSSNCCRCNNEFYMIRPRPKIYIQLLSAKNSASIWAYYLHQLEIHLINIQLGADPHNPKMCTYTLYILFLAQIIMQNQGELQNV